MVYKCCQEQLSILVLPTLFNIFLPGKIIRPNVEDCCLEEIQQSAKIYANEEEYEDNVGLKIY
jgi:hypothetical protein